jgi:hypothetical protein
MKPQKMEEVLWDYIRADIYANEYIKRDTNRNAVIENLQLQDKIFKLHHTTREEFYKSYTYYSNRKELMTSMIDSMVAKKQREKLREKKAVKPVSLTP